MTSNDFALDALTVIAKAQYEANQKAGWRSADLTFEQAVEQKEYGGEISTRSELEWVGDLWYELGWSERIEDPAHKYGRYEKHDLIVNFRSFDYVAKIVETTGGEGEGSRASAVIELTPIKDGPTLHFRKNGYYASHYGYDWDGEFERVEPFEVTVIDYRAVA